MQTRVLTVGDIHGRSIWKNFLFGSYENFEAWKDSVLSENTPAWENALDIVFSDIDKVVFVGDYFDSFTVSNAEMKANVLDLFLFKRQYPERVFMLWGNHDVHYWDSSERCSAKLGSQPVGSRR
jgi:predicted MPP superfamily phosphohydrolase